MKLLILFLALAVTVNAAPFHRKPVAKPVAPAVAPSSLVAPETLPEPVATPEKPFTVNPDGSVTRSKQADAELKDWIIGIQTVDAKMAADAKAAEGSNQMTQSFLSAAKTYVEAFQIAVNKLTDDRNAQAAAKDTALDEVERQKAEVEKQKAEVKKEKLETAKYSRAYNRATWPLAFFAAAFVFASLMHITNLPVIGTLTSQYRLAGCAVLSLATLFAAHALIGRFAFA